MKTGMWWDGLMMVLLLQVVTILSALAVAVQAVPISAIEESYGHIAVAPITLSHAPALQISHAPVGIAHAPVIKEVEHDVSICSSRFAVLKLELCKQRERMESLLSLVYTYFPNSVCIIPECET
jgi:hypothetical protein